MKNLKNKECLFPLTMPILTDYSRQYHNCTEVNGWEKKCFKKAYKVQNEVFHINHSILNFKTKNHAIKVTYTKRLLLDAILGS